MHRLVSVFACCVAASVQAQHPLRHFTDAVDARFSRSQPIVHYTLTITAGDTTGWDVRMDVRNAPDAFRVAMAKHPEYDDRYFRFVQDLRVAPTGSIVREDSALWRVIAPGGATTISYRIQLPQTTPPAFAPSSSMRPAWKPFLASTGGLAGGPHAFMYVVGAELAPVHVSLRIPAGWDVKTALTPTSDPRTYFAPSAYVLVESPILLGQLHTWKFAIDGVPHTIVYWPLPNAAPFDTATFASNIERLTNEVVRFFGRAPYREYLFLYQDNAYGALEHAGSVTLGAPSAELAHNPNYVLAETAHEYFHTWNLMRIRPLEYAANVAGVDYRAIEPVPTLWFSEGLTMMYADLLLRRAKLPTYDSTRVSHLEHLMNRYWDSPGNSRFSAEAVSRVAYNSTPYELGDYEASTHLQGELIGTMLDLIIRDATTNGRSMDDVMQLMLQRFSGERGFTSADVERAVSDVCDCSVKAFFDAHVRGNRPIDFNRYLALIGMRAHVTREPVVRDGQAEPDLRVRVWNARPDSALRVIIANPESIWGRAGLHSRDRVLSVNGATPKAWPEFHEIVGRARIGDTLRLVVQAPNAVARTATVVVAGYEQSVVHIETLARPTGKQQGLRDAWLSARP